MHLIKIKLLFQILVKERIKGFIQYFVYLSSFFFLLLDYITMTNAIQND